MQKSTVNYGNPEQNTLCTAESKEGGAPQVLLTTPWAEPQLWLSDHLKKEDVNCWDSCQGHRHATDLQQEERGATPWLTLSSPGWSLHPERLLPIGWWGAKLKGQKFLQAIGKRTCVTNEIFQGLAIPYLCDTQAKDYKNAFWLSKQGGFYSTSFFPLHVTTKHWKWSQLS